MIDFVDFKAGETTARGYLATPSTGEGAGILVFHAWWGLNSTFTGLCDRLAGEGFVALAPDLFRGRLAATVGQAEALRAEWDFPYMQTVVDGALAYLRSRPEVRGKRSGLMGFSMGASWSYAISTQEPEAVAAVVAFYGTHSSPQGAYNAACAAYLGHYSDQDEWEPLEDVRQLESELRAAGREVTFHIYPGAKHWFFEPDRGDAYDPALAALAWQRSAEFLHGHLD